MRDFMGAACCDQSCCDAGCGLLRHRTATMGRGSSRRRRTWGESSGPGRPRSTRPRANTASPAAARTCGGASTRFSFVWKKVSGDLELSAEVNWEGEGKNAHRKAGVMVRQDLEPDSPYADAVVHGDGLISLQFRRVRSGPTLEVKSPIKPPASIKLERNGDLFTLSVCTEGRGLSAGRVGDRCLARGGPCRPCGVLARYGGF